MMPTSTISISPLREEDIPGAVDAIQEAFAEDPYNLWVYNDRSKLNLNRNRVSLGIRCRWGIRNALFYVAKDLVSDEKDKVLGIAMWIPPRQTKLKKTWGEWLEGWKLWCQQVGMNVWYGRGGLNVKRYYIWKQRQAEAQSEIWTDPKGYYFCNVIVVLPEAQGKGIGRALFREVTQKADAEGRRCYLESSRDEPNTKIYEAMGFHFVKQMDCDDGGDVCQLYCMVREPQSPL
ncbi:acyl-CoA N-acyltransferase [Hyaloscypha bicolor E]|uniref:Acyl-CoA N-acyltransferase n=1 Tax=Hyaloscypha bicolor E TaxID=1095630 RepID=A0A2J6T7H5_9HELO|nr:acyl-CoA N-acyltransferase [Hyaloscypha bicolor E]PMD58972.1 acyl-CoA N-acyltransferase [Hyaloscypha bicolor E]